MRERIAQLEASLSAVSPARSYEDDPDLFCRRQGPRSNRKRKRDREGKRNSAETVAVVRQVTVPGGGIVRHQQVLAIGIQSKILFLRPRGCAPLTPKDFAGSLPSWNEYFFILQTPIPLSLFCENGELSTTCYRYHRYWYYTNRRDTGNHEFFQHFSFKTGSIFLGVIRLKIMSH